jgi:hypothetical protein
MSQEKDALSQVLSRINALANQPQPTTPPGTSHAGGVDLADIPVLTEVYEGDIPEQGIANPDIPLLDDTVAALPAGVNSEVLESLLVEMESRIKAIVKDAVMQELVLAKKSVVPKLEQEVMQLLRRHLEKTLKNKG